MAFANAKSFVDKKKPGDATDGQDIRNKKIWKSLRTHILSRRKKIRQAEADAEILRKKKYIENQKIQENKLSLEQINGRLSELRKKRDELEEEKRTLLNQAQSTDNAALRLPKAEFNCEHSNNVQTNGRISPRSLFQHQHNIIGLLATQNYVHSPNSEFSALPHRPVIIPTNVNGTTRQNFWIIHPPH